MKKQIIRNLFSNYLVNTLQMVLGILIVPFLIIKLGKESFGLIVLVESTIGMFEVMVGGVRIALARHATFALGKGDMDEFNKYLSTGRYIFFIIGFIVLLAGGAISFLFPHIFKVPSYLSDSSKLLFLIITCSFFITIPNIVFWSVLYSKQRFDLLNLASSFGLISRAVFLLILFSFLPARFIGLFTYGLVYLLTKAAENSLIFFWHKKIMPGLKLSLKNFQSGKVREIITFSGYTSLSSVSSLLYENTANILINVFFGPVYNAIYSVSLKIPMTINNIFLRSTWSLAPTVTDLVAKNDTGRLKRLYFTYSKILCIITLPVILLIIVMSEHIITLWVGPGFIQSAGLLSVHLIATMFILPLSVINLTSTAYAKVKIPSQITATIAVFNVFLGIFLAQFLGYKLYGFAIAAAFCTIMNNAVFLPCYSSKISGIPLFEYMFNAFLKPFFLGCLVIIPLYYITKMLIARPTLIMLSVQSALTISVYYLFAYKFLIDTDEKNIITGFMNNRSI